MKYLTFMKSKVKALKKVSILMLIGLSNLIEINPANAIENGDTFFIYPLENPDLAIDAFGDDLPNVKTHAHLYQKAGSGKTHQMYALLQPENNNSFEIHMQNKRDVCYGPEANSPRQMYESIPAVMKADCANTLNHIFEGEQIRVNNSNFCVTYSGSTPNQLGRIKYNTCNGANNQRFATEKFFGKSPLAKTFPGSCYRPNDKYISFSHRFAAGTKKVETLCQAIFGYYDIPEGTTYVNWLGGAYATIVFHTPQFSQNGASTTDKLKSLDLNNETGDVQIPTGATRYDILPWNENTTTSFQFVKK
jgi:hypothetical protein